MSLPYLLFFELQILLSCTKVNFDIIGIPESRIKQRKHLKTLTSSLHVFVSCTYREWKGPMQEEQTHVGDFNVDLLKYTTGTGTAQVLDQMYSSSLMFSNNITQSYENKIKNSNSTLFLDMCNCMCTHRHTSKFACAIYHTCKIMVYIFKRVCENG